MFLLHYFIIFEYRFNWLSLLMKNMFSNLYLGHLNFRKGWLIIRLVMTLIHSWRRIQYMVFIRSSGQILIGIFSFFSIRLQIKVDFFMHGLLQLWSSLWSPLLLASKSGNRGKSSRSLKMNFGSEIKHLLSRSMKTARQLCMKILNLLLPSVRTLTMVPTKRRETSLPSVQIHTMELEKKRSMKTA